MKNQSKTKLGIKLCKLRSSFKTKWSTENRRLENRFYIQVYLCRFAIRQKMPRRGHECPLLAAMRSSVPTDFWHKICSTRGKIWVIDNRNNSYHSLLCWLSLSLQAKSFIKNCSCFETLIVQDGNLSLRPFYCFFCHVYDNSKSIFHCHWCPCRRMFPRQSVIWDKNGSHIWSCRGRISWHWCEGEYEKFIFITLSSRLEYLFAFVLFLSQIWFCVFVLVSYWITLNLINVILLMIDGGCLYCSVDCCVWSLNWINAYKNKAVTELLPLFTIVYNKNVLSNSPKPS